MATERFHRARTEIVCAASLGASLGIAWATFEEGRILARRLSILTSFEEISWDLLRPEVLLEAMALYAAIFSLFLLLVAAGRLLARRATGEIPSTLAAQTGWLFPFFVLMAYRLLRKLVLRGNPFLTEIPPPTFTEWAVVCGGWAPVALLAGGVLGRLAKRPWLSWLFTLRIQWIVAAALVLFLGLPSLLPRALLSRTALQPPGRKLAVERDPSAPAAGWNVVLVVMDTARADRFGAYGYGRSASPAFDALARRGTLFLDARSTAPWTLPAHASLFTGLYPSSHRATGDHTFLDEEIPTLAEVVSSAGYDTACFTNNSWLGVFTGMTRGFQDFVPVWHRHLAVGNSVWDLLPLRFLNVLIRRVKDEGADLTTRLALLWLESRKPDRPYFLFLNFMEAHQPNYPSPWAARFLPRNLTPEDRASLAMDNKLHESGLERFTPRQLALQSDLYDGEIAYLDSVVGGLLAKMETGGMLERTLVVVTSDHGENLGERGQLDHQFGLWDTVLDIPLLIATLGARPIVGAGRRSEAPVQIVDVPATIADLLGLRLTGFAREGRSLAGLLTDDRPPPPRPQVAEYDAPRFAIEVLRRVNPDFAPDPARLHLRAWVDPPYKLIWRSGGPASLFRIGAEEEDLAAREPEIAASMGARLGAWVEAHGADRAGGAARPVPAPDAATRELLKALGYAR